MTSAPRRRHRPRNPFLGLVGAARRRRDRPRQGQTRSAALVSALTATLLVLMGGMAMWGFVMPDVPGVEQQTTQPQQAVGGSRELGDTAAPVSLRVPSLDVVAPIVPIAVSDDRVLDPPRDPVEVGWWEESAEPGAGLGQTVITGHTVSTGGGSMDRIGELQPGEKVDVVSETGVMTYRVDDIEVLSYAEVAEQAETLFGQHLGEGRLVLITCTDYNGSFYESNVFVYGEPIGRLEKKSAA